MPDDVALSADERAELERLRAEVADLRSRSGRLPHRPLNHRSTGSGWAEQGYRLAAGRCRKAGFRTGPVGAWVYTYKRVLWIVVIAIAALVLVFWDQPTGKVIIGITLAVLVALVTLLVLIKAPRNSGGRSASCRFRSVAGWLSTA